MTLHREGKTILLTAIVIVLAINALVAYFLPEQVYIREAVVVITAVFYLLLVQFFRVPKRVTPINPQDIIAPADGKVVVIEEAVERFQFSCRLSTYTLILTLFRVSFLISNTTRVNIW